MAEQVAVALHLLSGEVRMGKVLRNSSCLDLFLMVQSVAGMRVGSFKLILGTEILRPDVGICPFQSSTERSFVVTVLRESLDVIQPEDCSFADLVRRMPAMALSVFLFSNDQRAQARERDTQGDSALAWALYKARQQPAAARLAAEILRRLPNEARVRNESTGFSPLHDAAWGHAPQDLAVLLCAIYPSAALQRNKQGELPDDVGRYYHRNFSWPLPQELISEGAALRASTRRQRCFRLVRWLRADGSLAPLNLPSRPASLVLGFLSLSKLSTSGMTRQPESGHAAAEPSDIELSLPPHVSSKLSSGEVKCVFASSEEIRCEMGVACKGVPSVLLS